MIKVLLCAILSLTTFSALAETEYIFSGWSNHLFSDTYTYKGETRDLNEDNYGFGIQMDDIRCLMFKNSYYKTSMACMWVPDIKDTGFNLVLGASTGYQHTPQRLPLAPVFGFEYPIDLGDVKLVPGFLFPGTATLHVRW